ncbi:sporulation histidine kinase inhibitor Sda [Lentibacillus sp. L22]|uniref:sporulation histidine kinase inhibitor Sda n=1 Tax=Lentibacillus TaxID=175304 RepID=UPI0034654051
MESISNELLIEAYYKATQMKLDNQFIHLIKKELSERSISVEETTDNYRFDNGNYIKNKRTLSY